MADHTHIEWTDATWNPITGCSVVSAGCKHCYAMKLAGGRLQHIPSRTGLTVQTQAGPVWNGIVRFNPEWLHQPMSWRRPRRVFVCAHGDLFHENVPDAWIDMVFAVMALSPQHTFQVLTKRADRMLKYLQNVTFDRMLSRFGSPPDFLFNICRREMEVRLTGEPEGARKHYGTQPAWPLQNVWLGVSVENQATADERIPLLLKAPAAVRWVSAEPLLGPVSLWPSAFLPCPTTGGEMMMDPTTGAHECCRRCDYTGVGEEAGIDWVVVGGESGADARPMHPAWARSLRDQCAAAGVPFLFKQWGGWRPPLDGEAYNTANGRAQRVPCFIVAPTGTLHCFENGAWTHGGEVMRCVGKKAAGRLLDGVLHDEYPAVRA